jgi:hypothetical protein
MLNFICGLVVLSWRFVIIDLNEKLLIVGLYSDEQGISHYSSFSYILYVHLAHFLYFDFQDHLGLGSFKIPSMILVQK